MVHRQETPCGKVTYSNNIGGYYRGHSRCRNLLHSSPLPESSSRTVFRHTQALEIDPGAFAHTLGSGVVEPVGAG